MTLSKQPSPSILQIALKAALEADSENRVDSGEIKKNADKNEGDKKTPRVTVVLDNIRSAWNVGSVMRTCDALGFDLILLGYTPRPIGQTLKLIKKTAIGAENTVNWDFFETAGELLEYQLLTNNHLNQNPYSQNHLDQKSNQTTISEFLVSSDTSILDACDLEIQNNKIQNNPENSLFEQKTFINLGIEICDTSQSFYDFLDQKLDSLKPHNITNLDRIYIWFGNEIHGMSVDLMKKMDENLYLPMKGSKESLNISSSMAVAGYLLDYYLKSKLN